MSNLEDVMRSIMQSSSQESLSEMLNDGDAQKYLRFVARQRGVSLVELKENIERTVMRRIHTNKLGNTNTERAGNRGYDIMKARIDGGDPKVMAALRSIAANNFGGDLERAKQHLLDNTKAVAEARSSPAKSILSGKKRPKRKNVFLEMDGISESTELDFDGNPVPESQVHYATRHPAGNASMLCGLNCI